jgi:circadian clock protein KaiB
MAKTPPADKQSEKTKETKKKPSHPIAFKMRLFLAGDELNSTLARRNLNEICQTYLAGRAEITIIDVFRDFDMAVDENILVTPALVVDRPKSLRIFGNLQDRGAVLAALGIDPREPLPEKCKEKQS